MQINVTSATIGYSMIALKMIMEDKILTGREYNPDIKKYMKKAYDQLNKESKKHLK